MKVVVDACVGLKWVLDEEGSDLAARLIKSGHELAVPDFWLNEATNVLWLRVRRGVLTSDQARDALQLLRETCPPVPTAPFKLHEVALELGIAVGHSPYDTLYASFAMAIGARVIVTADARLISALRKHPDEAIASLPVALSQLVT